MNSKIICFTGLTIFLLLFSCCVNNEAQSASTTSSTINNPLIPKNNSEIDEPIIQVISEDNNGSINAAIEDAGEEINRSLDRTIPGVDGAPGLDVFHDYYPPMLLDVGGELAYTAYEDYRLYIHYKNQRLGGEYDTVDYPTVIKGKLAYAAPKGNETYIIWGNESNKIPDGYYIITSISPIFQTVAEDNGKIAYEICDQPPSVQMNHSYLHPTPRYYIYNQENFYEITDKYSEIYLVPSIEGKLTYIAALPESSGKIIVSGGEELGREYDDIIMAGEGNAVLGGKLGYIAQKGDDFYFVYNGEETKMAPPYEIAMAADVEGRTALLIVTQGSSRWAAKFFIRYNGEDIGREYDTICPYFGLPIGKCITVADGKIAYIAQEKDKNFVVYDGKELGLEYDQVYSIESVGNKLAYLASKGNNFHIVYDGKTITVPALKLKKATLSEGLNIQQ